MKKIISMILAVAMSAMCITVASATQDDRLNTTVKLDATTNSIVVSGTVNTDRSGVPMVLLIEENNGIVWGGQLTTQTPEEGVAHFTFDSYTIPANKASTTYKVMVSAEFIDETDVINLTYGGIDQKYNVLDKITDYDSSVSPSEMRTNVIESYPEIIGIDTDVYTDLSETAKEIIAKIVAIETYTCPAGYQDDADVAKINEQIQKFAKAYEEAEAIAATADIDGEAELLTWVNGYGTKYGFSQDDSETTDNEAKLYTDYFVKIDKTEELIARINDAASIAETFNEFRNLIFDRVLLTYIETGNYSKTKEIVAAFPKKFEDIKSTKRVNTVYMGVTGKYYGTIKTFCDTCNAYKLSVEGGVGGSSSGSSSSSGGSGKGSSTITIEKDTTSSAGKPIGFVDMANYTWATTAVNYLYNLGIVSGKADNIFAPADNVTRAEFAKILVNSKNIDTSDYEGQFKDVSSSDWYAPFVAAAAEKGIIQGADGYFKPNEKITRQDMAVMIKRALDLDVSDFEAVFEDSANISDYAGKAVYAVYKKGIMRGGGDGYFNPQSNATRAEAAQTVYNMLTK